MVHGIILEQRRISINVANESNSNCSKIKLIKKLAHVCEASKSLNLNKRKIQQH